MTNLMKFVAGAAIVFAASLDAQTPFETQLSTYAPDRPGDTVDRPPKTARYAKGEFTDLAVYRASKGDARGLVVVLGDVDLYGKGRGFPHGRFVQRLVDDGIAVAYIGARPAHRFGMRATVEDFSKGVAYIFAHPEKFRASGNIVLVGIGVGAEQAALLGTDPSLLTSNGVNFDRLRLVSLINSTPLDGPTAVANCPALHRRDYLKAYGVEEAAQLSASAAGHVGREDVPVIYVLNEVRREGWGKEAEPVIARLETAGVKVIRETMPEQIKSPNIPTSSKFGDDRHLASQRLIKVIEDELTGR